jgi:non-ribosomal peptide synthetase component F/aryl carrier-like protein
MWIAEPDNPNKLVPIGTSGEILIEGPLLARHYLGDEEKTRIAFIENPAWAAEQPQHGGRIRRLYRTGDLGRQNTDGSFTMLGRKDTQVKLRGQRIEMSEVEYHLQRSLPGDISVVVEVVKPGSGKGNVANGMIIAAFFTVSTDDDGMHREFRDSKNVHVVTDMTESRRNEVAKMLALARAKLQVALPVFMIPSAFIPINAIPHSSSNKTDRNRLRQLASNMSVRELDIFSPVAVEKRQPRTAAESQMRQLWSEVLNCQAESIGIDDSFLRIGGDSITAMRLVAKARDFNLDLTVEQTFRNPVLADMASNAHVISQEIAPIEPFSLILRQLDVDSLCQTACYQCQLDGEDAIEDVYPCTSLQDGLMALSIKNPGTYVAQFIYTLPDTLDVERFKEAWKQTARKVSALRTRVIQSKSRLMQVVIKGDIDWKSSNDLDAYLQQDKLTFMDIGTPLSRFAIIGERRDAHFIFTAHHAIYDGWSLEPLFQQVAEAYLDLPVQRPATDFRRFIKYLMSIDPKDSEQYWRNQLQGAIPPAFPQLPTIYYQPSASHHLQHKIQLSDRARSDVSSSNITVSTQIRAALSILLSRYFESRDIIFATTLSGRTVPVPGISDIVSPTFATIPVRVIFDDSADATIEEFLVQLQDQSTETMPYEQYGLQNIKQLSSDINAACNIQTLLVVQTATERSIKQNKLGLRLVSSGAPTAFHSFAMSLECTLESSSVQVIATFDPAVIEEIQMERFLYQFEHILKQVVHRSGTEKLRDIDMVSPQDRNEILNWNKLPLVASSDLVHRLVERRALQHPNDMAVCSWEGELSYGKLSQLSSRLARVLMEKGVRENVLVPLLFEKSIWAIVSMLSILKAGGACVALDPAHPTERLQGLVEKIEAKIMLSSLSNSQKASQLCDVTLPVGPDYLETLPESAQPFECENMTPMGAAFILFTSGSTGTPKGIVIDHSAFTSSIKSHSSPLRYGRRGDQNVQSRNFQFTQYTSDVSIGEIFTSLAVGSCVCVPSDEERMNDLAGVMERLRVNWAFFTPSVATLLKPADVPSLRTLVFGGETATAENISAWACAPNIYLINSFGPAGKLF